MLDRDLLRRILLDVTGPLESGSERLHDGDASRDGLDRPLQQPRCGKSLGLIGDLARSRGAAVRVGILQADRKASHGEDERPGDADGACADDRDGPFRTHDNDSIGVFSSAKRATSAWVANQTPPAAFAWRMISSRIQMRER